MTIYVDADACPVKDETYRVARRYDLPVFVVANSGLFVPNQPKVERVVVRGGMDEADNWIAERIEAGDIAVTADIPLADRCLRRGAAVLSFRGHPFTEDDIGEALATRELLDSLRQTGQIMGGPAPFGPKDRSRYLGQLDATIQAIRRRK